MKTKKERLPVYQNIKNEMREWIQTGIWKQGGLIPLEAALAKEFGCACATINRALRELTQKGILERPPQSWNPRSDARRAFSKF